MLRQVDELRKLAAAKLVHEKPGQTLQATALEYQRRGKNSQLMAEWAISTCLDLAREYESSQKFEQAARQYKQAIALLREHSSGHDPRIEKR